MNPCPDSGHVFLLHCDVEHLAADAVLVPGNPGPKTGVIAIESKDPRVHLFEAADFRGLLTPDKVIFHVVDVVRAFLEQATAVIGDARSQFKRAKPLLALPIFGVGRMDPDDLIRGEGSIVRALLSLLYEHASHSKLDVALCTVDKSAYQVMQVERDNLCPFKDGPFWMLSPKVKMHAEQLAKDALRGSLSLFVGAGASYPSGLPSWGGLLSDLAKKAGFTEAEQAELKSMDYLDQPTLIEERMGEYARRDRAQRARSPSCTGALRSRATSCSRGKTTCGTRTTGERCAGWCNRCC